MNVEVLMSKAAHCSPPAVGAKYLTKNWDDSLEIVRVVAVNGETVTLEYIDGVQHRVSTLYFWEGLEALLAQ